MTQQLIDDFHYLIRQLLNQQRQCSLSEKCHMNQLSSAGNRFCSCTTNGSPVVLHIHCLMLHCLPFPGSPGPRGQRFGTQTRLQQWKSKPARAKLPLQLHWVVVISPWTGSLNNSGIDLKNTTPHLKGRSFSSNRFNVGRVIDAYNFHNKHPLFKSRSRNCHRS